VFRVLQICCFQASPFWVYCQRHSLADRTQETLREKEHVDADVVVVDVAVVNVKNELLYVSFVTYP